MAKLSPKTIAKRIDQRVERAYYARCSGVQINIMDIGKVFKVGKDAIAADPAISDEVLGNKVAEFVETIRHN